MKCNNLIKILFRESLLLDSTLEIYVNYIIRSFSTEQDRDPSRESRELKVKVELEVLPHDKTKAGGTANTERIEFHTT